MAGIIKQPTQFGEIISEGTFKISGICILWRQCTVGRFRDSSAGAGEWGLMVFSEKDSIHSSLSCIWWTTFEDVSGNSVIIQRN